MYKVELPNFEGPLDLLLFFIKRDELDIYDIPIARITSEFLDYVRLMELLDLELAGEFLVMASMLMQIKVRMLLPREERGENEEAEEEDPRSELVRRLLEYKRYKESAEQLAKRAEVERYAYYRQFFKADAVSTDDEEDLLSNVTLFDLIAAFKRAMERAPREAPKHRIEFEPVTIEEQADFIMGELQEKKQISFFTATNALHIGAVIVTFLAILELMRAGRLAIRQSAAFEDILLYRPD